MKLKPDKMLRDRWFVPAAMSHPAKGHLGMWWELFERYTNPGQWVLDPMAGIGSSMIGAMMGRNVICNEMESHFIEPMKASWAKMRQQAMLGCELGQVVIIQGDARCLPLGRADVVVTSPPYEGIISSGEGPGASGHNVSSSNPSYTRPAAVITSPPYEDSLHGDDPEGARERKAERYANGEFEALRPDCWSSPTNNASKGVGGGYTRLGRDKGQSNIGNLRGNAYWEAMRLVYAECHRVLQPGGVMVLVVKGYTRGGQYIDLPQQTVDECEKLGFKLQERWDRELWGLSFWRILQGTTKQTRQVALQMGLTEESTIEIIETKRVNNGKVDERLRFEPVLVLKKV